MTLPLFVSDNGDLMVFQTREDAERYIEAVDVPSYLAFDAASRLVRLSVVPEELRGQCTPEVTIALWGSEPDESRFRPILAEFLSNVEPNLEWFTRTMPELVTAAMRYARA